MTIEIKAYVNVCLCDTEDDTTIYFDLDHDVTREDLDEFVKDRGYSNYKSYFADYITDEDDLKDAIEYVENDQLPIEDIISLYCEDGKTFKEFIASKYQNEAVEGFLKQLEDAPIDSVEC